ncbi:unnamed protein product [Peniophora sp. CBMAI 1063]|nr:unnamed protein product [Peniophora sp. CBMAI 1063]
MQTQTSKRDANAAGIDTHEQDGAKRHKPDVHTDLLNSPTTPGITELLNLSSGEPVTPESAHARFALIAQSLLHEHRIVWCNAAASAREEYEIVELEFYLNSEEHPDPYTHGSEEQTALGQWYFHRAPRKTPAPQPTAGSKPAGYRGGTRKGLDITLGCPLGHTGKKMRGGILLRTVRRISDGRIISGPSLLVDELLRVSSATSLTTLVDEHWIGNISIDHHSPDAKSWLSLERIDKSGACGTIYHSPRIGLDLSHSSVQVNKENPRIRFVCAHYRFFMHPDLLIANGRGQTFLGVVVCAQKWFGYSPDMLVLNAPGRVGLQQKTAMKYLETYRKAREKKNLRDFIGPVGKAAGSSAVPFLEMAGALRRYLDLEEP